MNETEIKQNRWTQSEIDFLINNYEDMSYSELSKKLNHTEKAIKIKAHKLGIKKSGIYYDVHKFDTISDEESAYWLGFIFADGYVYIAHKTNYFGVELSSKDVEHLRKLNLFMDGNAKITFRQRKGGRWDTISEICSIRFSGKHLVEKLCELGCVQRKTSILDMPKDIPELYMRHFIRGYFDGNGTISSELKTGYLKCRIISGSNIFCQKLSEYLNGIGIDCVSRKEAEHTYCVQITKQNEIINFLNYIYKDSVVYLDRKYNKYLEIIRPST